MEAPKAGRLAVLRAVRANLSPIFMAYGDPSRPHQRDVRADRRRRARRCSRRRDEEGTTAPALARLRGRAAARRDRGRRQPSAHDHRRPPPLRDGARLPRRAARRRWRSGRAPAYDFAPVYLANRHDPGLVLFPTHRVVSGLEPDAVGAPARAAGRALGARGGPRRRPRSSGASLARPRRALVRPRARRRPAAALRAPARRGRARRSTSSPSRRSCSATCSGLDAEAIATTDRIAYRQRGRGRGRARRRRAAAHRRRPARARADASPTSRPSPTPIRRCRPKSTFFFPKILDGMVFNQLDPFDP